MYPGRVGRMVNYKYTGKVAGFGRGRRAWDEIPLYILSYHVQYVTASRDALKA
jgi:hypothetical protein